MKSQFLNPPRWPGGPKICIVANLPAFETEADAIASNERNGHLPILVRWHCKSCGGFHQFVTGYPTDSNGAYRSEGERIPLGIMRIIKENNSL